MTPTSTPIAARLESGMVTIRGARSTDEPALIRLAGRDTRPLPRGPVIVAELDGELVAARSLTDGLAIADPFRDTEDVAQLLARAAQSATPGVLGHGDHSRERKRRRRAFSLAPRLTRRPRTRVA
jgi:hypothetical protein